MRLTLARLPRVPVRDSRLSLRYRQGAREALKGELTTEGAWRVCDYLDLPETVEREHPLDDPLRFATVRLLDFFRHHWWEPAVAGMAESSPTAGEILRRVRAESDVIAAD